MKEAILQQKLAHKAKCMNSNDENKNRYESMKNKAKKVISKPMREKAEEVITELKNCQNGMLVKGLMIDNNKIEAGRCMRGSDGMLCFSEKERGKTWDFMERIMNDENNWDRNVEGDAVECPAVCVCRYEVVKVLS